MNDERMALTQIKRVLDKYVHGDLHITYGNDDFDESTCTYDMAYILAFLRYLTRVGLGERPTYVPDPTDLPNPYEDAE